jgi:hypothetical protein
MRYRKLDADGDMTFGRGPLNFWKDVPDAPAQAVKTRLGLWLGEWFLDRNAGTPYNTQVLGKYTGSTRDVVLRARMSGTIGVRSILTYGSQLNRETRVFSVQAKIDTIYGPAAIEGPF